MDAKENIRWLYQTVTAISSTFNARDSYTQLHQEGSAILARYLGQIIGLSKDTIECLRVSAILHDIGKVAIPMELLTKPGKLLPEEIALIKTHATNSFNILSKIDFPWQVADIAYQHHERLDGSGYPNGLKGNQMLFEAKILAVVDVFESMVADRPYRKTPGIALALKELNDNRDFLYDGSVVDAMNELVYNHLPLLREYSSQNKVSVIEKIIAFNGAG